MSNYINYRDYRFSLQAGQPQRVSVVGDYWQIIQAAAAVSLTFDDQVPITRYQGMGGPAAYQAVTLTSAVDQDVVVSLGRTDGRLPYDNRASGAGGGGPVVIAKTNIAAVIGPEDDINCPTGVTTLIFPADLTRLRASFSIPSTAVGVIRVGDSSTSATRGLAVEAGDKCELATVAPIYLYNGTGTDFVLSRLGEFA